MSADNFMYIQRSGDGLFVTSMESASAREPRDAFQAAKGGYSKVSETFLEAWAYATKICDETVVEYGIQLSDEVDEWQNANLITVEQPVLQRMFNGWYKMGKQQLAQNRRSSPPFGETILDMADANFAEDTALFTAKLHVIIPQDD